MGETKSAKLLGRMKARRKDDCRAVPQTGDLRDGRPHWEPPEEPDTAGLPCEGCAGTYGADFLTLWQDVMLCRRCLKFYRRNERA